MRSSTPPWSGSTGSTTAGSWSLLAMSRRPSSKPHSTARTTPATLLNSSNQASDEPGAIQVALQVELEAGLLGDQVAGEGWLPALIQDGLLHPLDTAVRLGSTGPDKGMAGAEV